MERRLAAVWSMACACGVATACATPAAAHAQPGGGGGAVGAAGSAGVSEADAMRRMAARQVTRLALVDLKTNLTPQRADYGVAAELLEIALELAPGNEQIMRRLAEASELAGRGERTTALRRELLKRDPKNTFVQLQLIESQVKGLQDGASRLKAYEKLVSGPGSERLDASVRSRLMLRAAVLVRERGEDAKFAEMLSDAIALDPTNKDAAALALRYYTEQGGGTVQGRLDLLATLLLADPFDGETYFAMSRELAQAGAYVGARRFFLLGVSLALREGAKGSQFEIERDTIRLFTDGPRVIEGELTTRVEGPRNDVRVILQQIADGTVKVTSEVPDPEDYRLPLEQDRVRLVAAMAANDAEAIDRSLKDIEGTARRGKEAVLDPKTRPLTMTEAKAKELVLMQDAEVAWLQLWSGRNIESAAAFIGEASKTTAASEEVVKRFTGWLKVRQGDLDGGEADLRDIADRDELARLGLALALELRGDVAGAAAAYEAAAHEFAGTLGAAWAKGRYKELAGAEMEASEEAVRLEAWAAGLPKWIDELVAKPEESLNLRAEIDAPDVIGLLDEVVVRVRFRSLAPAPLEMSEEGAVSTRLLLSPATVIGRELFTSGADGEVVMLDRRLRLNPREEVVIEVWPDIGFGGWAAELEGAAPHQTRWRVVQGFWMRDDGLYDPAPGGLATETRMVVRAALPETRLSGQALAELLGTASGSALTRALAGARTKLLQSSEALALSAEDKAVVAGAIAARYPLLSKEERMIAAVLTPSGRNTAGVMDAVDAVMLAETDPDVRSVVLVTRVAVSDDGALAEAANSGTDRLERVAAMLRERLSALDVLTYSRLREIKTGRGLERPFGEKQKETEIAAEEARKALKAASPGGTAPAK